MRANRWLRLLAIPLVIMAVVGWGRWPGCDPKPPPPPPHSPQVVKAFDTTAVVHDPAWFRTMYAKEFRLYILHSTTWGTTEPWWRTVEQTRMALDAGLMVAGYTRNPEHWQAGIEAFGPYADDIEFFTLDIETDPGVRPTRAMVDGIRAMGVRPVLYTGRYMWAELMGSSTAFADVPLWDTDVSGTVTEANQQVSLNSPPPVPYGGWNTPSNMRIGVQQSFATVVAGVEVDLNTFNLTWLNAA